MAPIRLGAIVVRGWGWAGLSRQSRSSTFGGPWVARYPRTKPWDAVFPDGPTSVLARSRRKE
jgi:hypothetical protein